MILWIFNNHISKLKIAKVGKFIFHSFHHIPHFFKGGWKVSPQGERGSCLAGTRGRAIDCGAMRYLPALRTFRHLGLATLTLVWILAFNMGKGRKDRGNMSNINEKHFIVFRLHWPCPNMSNISSCIGKWHLEQGGGCEEGDGAVILIQQDNRTF